MSYKICFYVYMSLMTEKKTHDNEGVPSFFSYCAFHMHLFFLWYLRVRNPLQYTRYRDLL